MAHSGEKKHNKNYRLAAEGGDWSPLGGIGFEQWPRVSRDLLVSVG